MALEDLVKEVLDREDKKDEQKRLRKRKRTNYNDSANNDFDAELDLEEEGELILCFHPQFILDDIIVNKNRTL